MSMYMPHDQQEIPLIEIVAQNWYIATYLNNPTIHFGLKIVQLAIIHIQLIVIAAMLNLMHLANSIIAV